MPGTFYSDPPRKQGKRLVLDLDQSLPYDGSRVELDCYHSPIYVVQVQESSPPLCGLCLLRDGFEAELPTRVHQFKVLAENGNPETTAKFLSHLVLAMGLRPPAPDEDLREWRRNRNSLAREQYTARSPLDHKKRIKRYRVEKFTKPSKLFPVASALWYVMGYQPPLGRVLVPAVSGWSEIQIATSLSTSLYDIHVRLAKGIRVAMGFLP